MVERITKDIPITVHPSDSNHCSTYCTFFSIRPDKSRYCTLFGSLLSTPNVTHGNMNEYRTPMCVELFN